MSGPYRIVLRPDNPGDAPLAGDQDGAPIAMDGRSVLRLDVNVTQAAGTAPTLDVAIQHGPTAQGPWATLASFAQRTGVGSEHKVFGPTDAYVRARSTIGGTAPAFRFTVTGHAI